MSVSLKLVVFTIKCSNCGEEMPEDSKFCTKCGAPVKLETKSTTVEPVIERFEKDPRLQEHWIRRLIAYIIDSIIVGAGTAIVLGVALFPIFIANISSFFNILSFPFLIGIVSILYFSIAESVYGASFGKHLLGLKIVTNSGATPTFEKAFLRNLSKIHPLLLLLDVVGGLITSSDFHQKYSDRMANTTVISEVVRGVWVR